MNIIPLELFFGEIWHLIYYFNLIWLVNIVLKLNWIEVNMKWNEKIETHTQSIY